MFRLAKEVKEGDIVYLPSGEESKVRSIGKGFEKGSLIFIHGKVWSQVYPDDLIEVKN